MTWHYPACCWWFIGSYSVYALSASMAARWVGHGREVMLGTFADARRRLDEKWQLFKEAA